MGEATVKTEPTPEGPAACASSREPLLTGKRPALPAKDYEEEEEEQVDKLQSAYDYKLLNAWLSHPVKKFKGSGRVCQLCSLSSIACGMLPFMCKVVCIVS
jgi:hypothetical protein